MSDWQKRDECVNWHPYTQHQTADLPIVICNGRGALVWDENGKEYIDAIASWWANPHGHCNPEIARAISQQLLELEHILFGGFTHPKAILLSEKLLSVLPQNQSKVFYSDNGSTAVEVALKMVLQYFANQGILKKNFIAFENAFHGDTFGAMATSGIGVFTQMFQDFFIEVKRIPIPNKENIAHVKALLSDYLNPNETAAFIFEPLVQGANGMLMYEAAYLDELILMCKEKKVLCIADEVMTGFGRTGKLFASDYLVQKPDLFCLSKALSGGFIPFAATTCAEFVFQAFKDTDTHKALFHGHTFMANPAGCAASLASIELSLKLETQKAIQEIQNQYKHYLPLFRNEDNCQSVRTLGVIFAVDLNVEIQDYYSDFRNQLYRYFIENGLILRPVGRTIYILPSYCISPVQLKKVLDCMLYLVKNLKSIAVM